MGIGELDIRTNRYPRRLDFLPVTTGSPSTSRNINRVNSSPTHRKHHRTLSYPRSSTVRHTIQTSTSLPFRYESTWPFSLNFLLPNHTIPTPLNRRLHHI